MSTRFALAELSPLDPSHVDALVRLARREDVVRFGTHLDSDGRAVWSVWIGDADPNRQLALAVFDGGELLAAARLTPIPRRRRMHVGVIELVAPDESEDAAVDSLLGAIVDAADRWYAVHRTVVNIPASHRRIDSLFASHGFEREVVRKRAVLTDGDYADLASLARVRSTPSATRFDPPGVPARGEPEGALTLRPIDPKRDGPWMARSFDDATVIHGTGQLPHQRAEVWVDRFANNPSDRIFAYAAEVNGAVVGAGVLAKEGAVRRRHTATLGMHIAIDAQSRGYGRALLREMIKKSDALGFLRLELGVFGDNLRAVRIYEAAGFVLEGTQRDNVFRNGGYTDSRLMARLLETPFKTRR